MARTRRLRRILVLGLVLAAAAPLASAARATSTAPGFLQHPVQGATYDAEPGIKIDPSSGRLYAYSFDSSIRTWTSTNDGQSWSPSGSAVGAGDADLAVGGPGLLYTAGLLDDGGTNTTIPVSVSKNGGQSFSSPVLLDRSATGVAWDRQWLAASGSRVVVTSRRVSDGTSNISLSGLVAWVSTDGGRHFGSPRSVAGDADESGPIFFAPDGTLWELYAATDGNNGDFLIKYAKSTNGGTSWSRAIVAREPDPQTGGDNFLTFYDPAHFPVITFDGHGTYYAAFSACDGLIVVHTSNCHVDVATSTNKGASWSSPRKLSATGHTAVFPWVATRPGRTTSNGADVVFFQARQTAGPDPGPDLGGPLTTWDVIVAQTRDGGKTWTNAVAAPAFHTGSECTSGIACPGPQQQGFGDVPTPFDRRDLDFFEVTVDGSGRAIAIYPNDRALGTSSNDDEVTSKINLMVAKQQMGTAL